MRKALKISVLIAILIMLSFAGKAYATAPAPAPSEYEVEAVGGTLSPINFITLFLVPVLAAIGILGVLILIGAIRIETGTGTNMNTEAEDDN